MRDNDNSFWKEVLQMIGALVFFALLGAFCWLCCAVSGYHWE